MPARLRWLVLAGLLASPFAVTPALARQDDPLPRFGEALCPGVVGLKVEAAEMMVGRIRARAEELGIRSAEVESCRPNVIVAFIGGGRSFLERLGKDRGYMFESLSPQERRDLLADEGPVHVLTQVRTRSRDGMIVPRRDNLTDPPQTEMWMAHSLITTATRKDIVSALVLIDPAAIEGMTIGQLADYVALRTFAPTLPELVEAGNGSLLSLFDAPAEARPAGLTEADLAALETLYQGPANLRGSARLAELDEATAGQRAGAE